jgi:ketosteroid isomerase-like protein
MTTLHSAREVVDRLLDALSSYDTDAIRSLCSPDLRHWLSITEREQGVDELLATVDRERQLVADSNFALRRRVETVDGAVLMLTVDGRTKRGASFHIPVCLVVAVEGDKVVRLDEFANVDQARELLKEMLDA